MIFEFVIERVTMSDVVRYFDERMQNRQHSKLRPLFNSLAFHFRQSDLAIVLVECVIGRHLISPKRGLFVDEGRNYLI